MKVSAKTYALPLLHPFGIARETRTIQRTFIVALTYKGHTGYGEATENAYYEVTIEKLQTIWEDIRSYLENLSPIYPPSIWKTILKKTNNCRFLTAAIDEALWDLTGKLKGIRTIDLLFSRYQNFPVSSYTIGIDSIDVMQQKILENPWPVYKIKLGTIHDEEILQALRKVTDKPFRIDANAAWDYNKTKKLLPFLTKIGVELVEQPLPAGAYKDMERLKEISPLPFFADESCVTEKDLEKTFQSFHGINVKLTKAGGITPAFYMYQKAEKYHKLKMIGCMTESTVGISAAAQLLPAVDVADLDGPLLLAQDIAQGIRVQANGYFFPNIPGNGVKMIRNSI